MVDGLSTVLEGPSLTSEEMPETYKIQLHLIGFEF